MDPQIRMQLEGVYEALESGRLNYIISCETIK